MDALEAMGSAMSMRWLSDQPVPDELVEKLLWAATRASNPGNSQLWDFVVVRDAAQRAKVARIIKESRDRAPAPRATAPPPRDGSTAPVPQGVTARMIAGGQHLIDHLADAPALIVICGTNAFPAHDPQLTWMLSAVYGAAQNLIVAARALGLGATYTTFHRDCEPAIKDLLGIPDQARICVTIPVGWPTRGFVPVKRRPLEDVVHYDHW